MEGMERSFGICWVLKEDQYLDSEVCFGVRGLVLRLGFTGKFLDTLVSSIDAEAKLNLNPFALFDRLVN